MQLVLLGDGVAPSPVTPPPGVSTQPALGFSPPPDNSLAGAGKDVRDALNMPQEGTTKNEGNKK